MKIQNIHISNYNSIKDIQIHVGDMLNLVGQNNAGKSNILRALDLFFNHSSQKITEETYHNRNTSVPIEITVDFCRLTDSEKKYFSSYVIDDILKVKRRFSWNSVECKATVAHIGYGKVPKLEWLREDEISGEKIIDWWAVKEQLTINGDKFTNYCGTTKPTVTIWKQSIPRFIEQNRTHIEYEELERDNISIINALLITGTMTDIRGLHIRWQRSMEAKFGGGTFRVSSNEFDEQRRIYDKFYWELPHNALLQEAS